MRAGVVGRLSVSSPLCARRIARAPLARVRARIRERAAGVPVRTSGTKSCANTSLPAGDIIALDP